MSKNIEENSSRFHDIVKGCRLAEHKRFLRKNKWGDECMIQQRCLTHEIIVCRCGWEIGFHLGTDTAYVKQQGEAWIKNHKNYSLGG